MRASSCLIGVVLLFTSVSVFTQPTPRAVLAQPARPIPVKAEYKHLRITNLPMDLGVGGLMDHRSCWDEVFENDAISLTI